MKSLKDYTIEELNNLPLWINFIKVVGPSGRIIRIPKIHRALVAEYDEDSPVCWWDEFGDVRYPVLTEDGWTRRRG